MKKLLSLLVIVLINSQCIGQENYGAFLSEGKVKNIVYKIYSQRNHFENFSKNAKNDSISDYELWEETIYKITRSYWDMELGESPNMDIESAKKKLFKFHSKILENNEFLQLTQQYEKEIEPILIKTLEYFGDETDTVNVVLIPVAGQGGTVKSLGSRKSIMPIGVNLVQSKKMLNSIVPHEYTHRYNQLKEGIPQDISIWFDKGKMFWSLWSEGLATYGTGAVTNDFSINNLMLSEEYNDFPANITEPDNLDSWLASQFLKQYEDALVNFENDEPRAKWFATNSTILREDLPPSIGYYLGYKVVKYSIEEFDYTFEQLLRFKPEELKGIGIRALNEIQRN